MSEATARALISSWRRKSSKPHQHRFGRWVFIPILRLCGSASVFSMFLFVLTFVLFLLLAPFHELGKHQAKEEIKSHFADLPSMTLTSPSGVKMTYHEVGCGLQFCGLYGTDHAITVPVSKIEWGESAPPETSAPKSR